jgi:hypothetical protein
MRKDAGTAAEKAAEKAAEVAGGVGRPGGSRARPGRAGAASHAAARRAPQRGECLGCGRPSWTLYCDGCAPPPSGRARDASAPPDLDDRDDRRWNGEAYRPMPSGRAARR